MRSFNRPLSTALVGLLLAGCKASASLTLSTPPSASASASAEASAEAEAGPPAVHIVRHGDKLTYENGEIEFETGSSALKGEATMPIIDRYAVVLKKYPSLKIRIEGHTDSRGSTRSNQQLSDQRARAIKAALVRRGIAADRLDTRGLGESQPERAEPAACRNRSEDTVDDSKLRECQEIWTSNRRAGFVVTEGAESLPTEGASLGEPEPAEEPLLADSADNNNRNPRRPDWALRMFGGYSMAIPGYTLHGGHLGLGVHASQRFGARKRGYIGGGPRLHYRGLRDRERSDISRYDLGMHQFGPEGNLLVGGGSARVVGLFSLRLGLGVSVLRGSFTENMTTTSFDAVALGGWLFAGPAVLGKINERWSLGGHADFGVVGSTGGGGVGFATEIGLNAAWHFGRGRRDGI